jgi:hypothetical protein
MFGFITIVLMLAFLIVLIWSCYTYDKIENFDIPYKETDLEKKVRSIKERYVLCSLRLLSK